MTFAWVAGDGMLNNKWVAHLPHYLQVLEKWSNILCPEHKTVYILGSQIDGVDLLAIGIDHFTVASMQAIREPFAIESRDIGFVAGRDDHGLVFF